MVGPIPVVRPGWRANERARGSVPGRGWRNLGRSLRSGPFRAQSADR